MQSGISETKKALDIISELFLVGQEKYKNLDLSKLVDEWKDLDSDEQKELLKAGSEAVLKALGNFGKYRSLVKIGLMFLK